MKAFLAIAVLTASLLTQACSPNQKTESTVQDPHKHDTPGQTRHGETVHVASLQTPKNLTPNKPVPLAIDIKDKAGKNVSNFDKVQEKLMHLVVVSDDLRFFQHIHPNYKGNGRFEISPNFSAPGSYTIFSDYKPSGENEQVSLQKLTIPGNVPLPTELEKFTNTKTLADTKVSLKFSEKTPTAGKEVKVVFDLQQISKKQPIKDLQPYLGEKGHLIIVKSSSPLTEADYVHAHALKDSPDGQIQFMTNFPQKGTYKIWLQFNRNGKINTTDFWVDVT